MGKIKGFKKIEKTGSTFIVYNKIKHYPINKEVGLKFLKCVQHCLKGMIWSLCYGTLLGAIREGDFIEGDVDIDLILHEQHYNKMPEIVECLRKQGCQADLITTYNANFIQIYFNGCPGHICSIQGAKIVHNFFEGKMKIAKIQGEDFPVPEEAEAWLEKRYGDWRTPMSAKEWYKLIETQKARFIKNK